MNSSLPILLGLPLLSSALAVSADCRPPDPNKASIVAPTDPAGARRATAPTSQRSTGEPTRPSRLAAQSQAPSANPQSAIRSPKSPSPSPSAKPDLTLLIASAVTAADAHPSISAKMRQQIHLFGQQLVGAGMYWQQGRGVQRRFRLELKVQVGDGATSFEQVCTGPELWVHEDLLERSTLSRIDVRRVRDAQARQPLGRTTSGAATALPLGGLPKLLENLQAAFRFSSVEEKRLDQLLVWRIEGEWKPAALAELFPEQKARLLSGQAADWSQLPGHIPQKIVLTLGHDDLFPYRIEYLRAQSGKKDTAATTQTLVKIELFEVQIGGPIDPQRFIYQPGSRPFVDQTEAYLKKLGIEAEVPQDAQRPAPPQVGVPVRH